jgi:hypothetical protein
MSHGAWKASEKDQAKALAKRFGQQLWRGIRDMEHCIRHTIQREGVSAWPASENLSEQETTRR